MRTIKEVIETSVRYEYDVIVCGGGTAGAVAALAAARAGARTLLIERYGFVGGTLLNGAGPIHSFFNLYKAFPGVEKTQVIRGIPGEIIERLIACGGCRGHLDMDKGGDYDSVITAIDWEKYKDLAFTMLEEAGADILLHTIVTGAVMDGNVIRGVIIEGKSGREAALAKVVIDTTGDGDVAAYAGAEFSDEHDSMALGYPFGMANVDMERVAAFAEEKGITTQLVRGDKGSEKDHIIRLGMDLKQVPEFTEFMEEESIWGPLGVSFYENDFSFINGCGLNGKNAIDTLSLTEAEVLLRHKAMRFADRLVKYVPGFEKAYVKWTPACVGIRFTRCITCEYDLSEEEIENGARFEDELMLYGFHDMAPRRMIKNGGLYCIPYRAFLPVRVDGLLVAGRLITSNQEAHMSTRNTASCMAQGQAVGVAAALSALEDVVPRKMDAGKIRKVLLEQNVFLGE